MRDSAPALRVRGYVWGTQILFIRLLVGAQGSVHTATTPAECIEVKKTRAHEIDCIGGIVSRGVNSLDDVPLAICEVQKLVHEDLIKDCQGLAQQFGDMAYHLSNYTVYEEKLEHALEYCDSTRCDHGCLQGAMSAFAYDMFTEFGGRSAEFRRRMYAICDSYRAGITHESCSHAVGVGLMNKQLEEIEEAIGVCFAWEIDGQESAASATACKEGAIAHYVQMYTHGFSLEGADKPSTKVDRVKLHTLCARFPREQSFNFFFDEISYCAFRAGVSLMYLTDLNATLVNQLCKQMPHGSRDSMGREVLSPEARCKQGVEWGETNSHRQKAGLCTDMSPPLPPPSSPPSLSPPAPLTPPSQPSPPHQAVSTAPVCIETSESNEAAPGLSKSVYLPLCGDVVPYAILQDAGSSEASVREAADAYRKGYSKLLQDLQAQAGRPISRVCSRAVRRELCRSSYQLCTTSAPPDTNLDASASTTVQGFVYCNASAHPQSYESAHVCEVQGSAHPGRWLEVCGGGESSAVPCLTVDTAECPELVKAATQHSEACLEDAAGETRRRGQGLEAGECFFQSEGSGGAMQFSAAQSDGSSMVLWADPSAAPRSPGDSTVDKGSDNVEYTSPDGSRSFADKHYGWFIAGGVVFLLPAMLACAYYGRQIYEDQFINRALRAAWSRMREQKEHFSDMSDNDEDDQDTEPSVRL
ncbi:hypothetical protein CYMTET_47264 [Cymbomonas tetramitiformis]|uniref:Uncharacterized protein n=1 Tax=Cymbomonas tetramitiformis TaxID=36881 RepID=A0AAE0EXW5_9CHLO|nr:hypothetical protein CYMTET_47264 [Cymbomonas tetramitiformis]